jgi:WXG100 family type VII secretion target
VTSGVAETQAQSAVMVDTAKKFDHGNESLQTMLKTLMSELSTLSGTWKGLGATAFEHVKHQYAEDLKALNQALSETAEAIRQSAVGYDSTDSEAASRVTNTGGDFRLPL